MAHSFTGNAFYNSTGNPANANWTVPSGSTVFVVGIVTQRGGGTSPRAGGAPTYDGNTLTQAGSLQSATETDCELWYLLAPPTGSNLTVSVPNTGGEQLHVKLSAYQSATGASAFDVEGGTNGTSVTASQAVTPTIDGAAITDVAGTGYRDPPSGNQTALSPADHGNYSSNNQYALQGTAGSITFSWTQGASDDWCIQVAAFKESSSGISGNGDLASGDSSLSGEGITQSLGNGSIDATASTLSGEGVSSSTGNGALVSGDSTLSGEGTVADPSIQGNGNLQAGDSAVAGEGTSSSVGNGDLASQSAIIAGEGISQSLGNGDIASASSAVSAEGTSASSGDGALSAGILVIDFYPEINYSADEVLDDIVTGASQSFNNATARPLSRAGFWLKKSNAPTGNAVAKLYAHSGTFGTSSVPTGAALATSDNFDVSTLTTSYQLINFEFSSPYEMAAGTNYCIAIEYTGTASDTVEAGYDSTSSTHAGNLANFDGTWSARSTRDLIFYLYEDEQLLAGSGTVQDPAIQGNGNLQAQDSAISAEGTTSSIGNGNLAANDSEVSGSGVGGAFVPEVVRPFVYRRKTRLKARKRVA